MFMMSDERVDMLYFEVRMFILKKFIFVENLSLMEINMTFIYIFELFPKASLSTFLLKFNISALF